MNSQPKILTSEFFVEDRRFFLLLPREKKEPRVVYNIGAAIGGWSGIMNAGLAPAERHLFEPVASHDRYRETLQDRLQRQPGWTLHPIALSDTNGTCTMSMGKAAENSTLVDMGHHPSLFNGRVQVPLCALTTMLRPTSFICRI